VTPWWVTSAVAIASWVWLAALTRGWIELRELLKEIYRLRTQQDPRHSGRSDEGHR
jgi:hypothetical protein